ncbi:MAG: chromate transporter [Elioraea sp.]|nr:chromate transporter [Elioraea sp.]
MPLRPGREAAPLPSLAAACRVWLTFGRVSFGGAAAQLALLHRLVVLERRWVSEERFALGLALSLLLPGPEAHKLATWLGFCLHGVVGGLAAGLLFLLPGALASAWLGLLYVANIGTPAVSALFFGLRGAVLAILAHAVVTLARRVLRGRRAVALAGAAFGAAFLFGVPPPAAVLAAAAVGLATGQDGAMRRETWSLGPAPAQARAAAAAGIGLFLLWAAIVVSALRTGGVGAAIIAFFAKVSVFAFGGAYTILAWVAEEAVAWRVWFSAADLIDGLALAETTPGPTLLVLQFLAVVAGAREGGIGHGTGLGFIAVAVLFLPSFALLFLAVPFGDRLAASGRARAGLASISAATVGLIASLGATFALAVLFRGVAWIGFGPLRLPLPGAPDWAAVAVGALGFVALFALRLRVVGTLAACAVAGMLIRSFAP